MTDKTAETNNTAASSKSTNSDSLKSPSSLSAILSLLSSAGTGLCWFLRDLQFRHALSSAPSSQHWLMIDVNIFLRRMILILTVVSLWFGLAAVLKRTKALDIFAFVIAIVLTVTVSYILYTTNSLGLWFNN